MSADLTQTGGKLVEHAPDVARVRRVLANGVALLLAYALPRVFTIGAVVIAARVLGTAEFGAYGTAAAYAVILSIVATLGMTPLLVREMARAPARTPTLMRAAHLAKTISNLVMLVALLAAGHTLLGYSPRVLGAAMLLGISCAIGAYVDNFAAYVQAVERMHLWTQASAAYGLVTGGLGAALVLTTRDMVWFSAAPIAGQAAALALLYRRVPAEVRVGAPATLGDVRGLLAALGPFAIAFVGLTVHSKADVLLLAHLRSASDVGLYAAGYKFIDVTQALAVIMAVAVYPSLSRLAPLRPGGSRGRWAGTRLLELALLAAVPAAGALQLGSPAAVELVFGDAYAASVPVVQLLAVAIPMLVINIVGGYVLGAAGEMRYVAGLYAVSVPLKLMLNAWLVPARGAPGAALAMLLTESALCVGMLVVLHRRVAAGPDARTWAAAGVGVAVAVILARLPIAPHGIVAPLLLLGLVTVWYARAGVVPAVERATLYEALRRRGGGIEAVR